MSIYKQLISSEQNQASSVSILKSEYLKFSTFWMENLTKPISDTNQSQIQRMIAQQFKIALSLDQISMFLTLYPKFRVDVAVWGLDDTVTREHLSDIILDFFLQCPHPTYKDKLSQQEMTQLYQLVQDQAKALNFSLLK